MRKMIGYIGAGLIGVGFIIMALANTLNSEMASVIQAVLGVVFIGAAIKKAVELKDEKD